MIFHISSGKKKINIVRGSLFWVGRFSRIMLSTLLGYEEVMDYPSIVQAKSSALSLGS